MPSFKTITDIKAQLTSKLADLTQIIQDRTRDTANFDFEQQQVCAQALVEQLQAWADDHDIQDMASIEQSLINQCIIKTKAILTKPSNDLGGDLADFMTLANQLQENPRLKNQGLAMMGLAAALLIGLMLVPSLISVPVLLGVVIGLQALTTATLFTLGFHWYEEANAKKPDVANAMLEINRFFSVPNQAVDQLTRNNSEHSDECGPVTI
jgi:hypothetical protein